MLTTLVRVIKSGWASFWRNKWLSSAAISMVSLAIFGITSLILVNVLINSLIDGLEDKIDISVYFKLDTAEEDILSVRNDLTKLVEVKSVEYISTQEALDRFKERHKDNEILMQSLEELNTNPLEASLNIKAKEASQYETIASFFNQGNAQDIIDKINYLENKAVIVRLASITKTIRQVGFIILLILAVLAVLVSYNTIRLTIYSSSKEIKIMKLVGASNWFTRGPFVIEGALYGVIAAIIAMLVMYPVLWYLSPRITAYLPGTDLFYFLQVNLIVLLFFQILIGLVLGIVSSLVAIRRYLEV
ncbi:ABC transporter permease, partial [Patescibacteria group bacterium]|nr:ABC transporter permease [Patescibacteria group bacterium]MBU1563543.1 ABC transporter permease [Patescibacteria group bacterium]